MAQFSSPVNYIVAMLVMFLSLRAISSQGPMDDYNHPLCDLDEKVVGIALTRRGIVMRRKLERNCRVSVSSFCFGGGMAQSGEDGHMNMTMMDRNMTMMDGNMTMMDGNMTMMDGNMTMMDGNMTMMDGNMTMMGGNMNRMGGNMNRKNNMPKGMMGGGRRGCGLNVTEPGKIGPDGRRRCRKVGKPTRLDITGVQRLNADMTEIRGGQGGGKPRAFLSVECEGPVTGLPNSTLDTDNTSMVPAIHIAVTVVVPGVDHTTNATFTLLAYIVRGNGTLFVGDDEYAISEGDIKFAINISQVVNWLCDNGQGNARVCANFLALSVSLEDDNDDDSANRKAANSARACKSNPARTCGQRSRLPNGGSMIAPNEVMVDGVRMSVTLTVTERGVFRLVVPAFNNSLFWDPVITAANEEDPQEVDQDDSDGDDGDSDDGTSGVGRNVMSTMGLLLAVILSLFFNQ